jgi:hypothetical protein
MHRRGAATSGAASTIRLGESWSPTLVCRLGVSDWACLQDHPATSNVRADELQTLTPDARAPAPRGQGRLRGHLLRPKRAPARRAAGTSIFGLGTGLGQVPLTAMMQSIMRRQGAATSVVASTNRLGESWFPTLVRRLGLSLSLEPPATSCVRADELQTTPQMHVPLRREARAVSDVTCSHPRGPLPCGQWASVGPVPDHHTLPLSRRTYLQRYS